MTQKLEQKHHFIDGEVYTRREIHKFRMGDVEDPDLMVAQPIWEWQETEAGKWIMENSLPAPSWHRNHDIYNYGYTYQIRAYLTSKQITYYELKFK